MFQTRGSYIWLLSKSEMIASSWLLSKNEWQADSADNNILTFIRCLQYKEVATVVIKATDEHYVSHGIVLETRNAVLGGYKFG